MRRILLRRIVVDALCAFTLAVIILGIFFGLKYITGYEEYESWEELVSGASSSCVGVFLVVRFRMIMFRLPDAIYLMPMSRRGRMGIVKLLFWIMWIVNGVLLCCFVNLKDVLSLLLGTSLDNLIGIEDFLLGCIVLLISHSLLFNQYFEINESLHTIITWFFSIFQFIGLLCVLEIVLDDGLAGIIVFGIVYSVSAIFNVWIHKTYFNEMMQFYADYESCNRLVEKKVST